jgi:hypothetical protein
MRSRHILHHRRSQQHFYLRAMHHRGVLLFACRSVSLPVSRRQLLHQSRRIAARVVFARLLRTFNWLHKLLGLPVWYILQCQRLCAASGVPSRFFVSPSEVHYTHAVFAWILLPFRRHDQRIAVSNRPLLSYQRTRICCTLSSWPLLGTIRSIIARHMFKMPVR